jgi:tetrapyrrole methylase family protein/MazG family protein
MSFKGQNPFQYFENLLKLVARLRRECPWDREQTHSSLKPFLLEEAYEVAEAVESGDPGKLKEELGDLLLIILLYCDISNEFSIKEVVEGTSDKMKARHPHVFGNEKLTSSQQVIERWEEIKRSEKTKKSLTALKKASLLNDGAMKAGFNPAQIEEVGEKLNEELAELRRARTHEEKENEAGDLLFTAVNICRMFRVEPESALMRSCTKFEQRLKRVFKELESQGKNPANTPFHEMDEIWDRIK